MSAATPTGYWWERPFRMFQTNIREIDTAELDVEDVLDRIEEYGADAWLLSVGGIVANHPSSLPFQSRNPGLARRPDGDLVGTAVRAAHGRGMRLLARMDFSKIAGRIAEEHPEWCYVDPQGRQQVVEGLVSVCPSAGYYQERMFAVLTEILDRYEIDGFFFNWLSYGEIDYGKVYRGVCQCLSCRRTFAAAHPGTPHPTDPGSPGYPEWKRWTVAMMDDLVARARDLISGRRPEAPLIMGNSSDIVFHEANNAIGRPMWHHHTAENVSRAKSWRPEVPVLVNAVAFFDMPYRSASEDPEVFAQYLVQAAARGANPSTYIMGLPHEFDYECLTAGSEIVRFHRDHPDLYTGLVPAAVTALVAPDPLAPGRSRVEAEEAEEEFKGLYLALVEGHVPFEVLPERRIAAAAAAGTLDRYRLLVLPDLGELDTAAVEALDGFGARGGRLLATASSGFAGEVPQLAACPAAQRRAVRATTEATWSSFLRTDPLPHRPAPGPLPVLGAMHVLTPAPGAEAGMGLVSRAPYGPPEKCYGHVELDTPGRVRSGPTAPGPRATWFATTLGRAYRGAGLSVLRDVVVAEAVRLLGDDLDVRTDLPPAVEVVLGRSAAGSVVHLRNLSGATRQSFGVPLPIRAGHRLGWRGLQAGDEVEAAVAGTRLVATRDERGEVGVDLPDVGRFEALLVRSPR
ncbi:hypothetical protein ACFFKU_05290 [Kineococcus gynurae]|uniref:Beta-galactosidase trimerisation domain-containing protein n=1 Tax=Kineococcus gynurae TaxID=452979 RepID=A0ABV5LN13_9ACTN